MAGRVAARGIHDAHRSWGTGETHAYRFSVRLEADPRSDGRSARRSFVWEAASPGGR